MENPLPDFWLNLVDVEPSQGDDVRLLNLEEMKFNAGDPTRFTAKVITPGLVAYTYPYPRGKEYENLPKEEIDASLANGIGIPLTINHCSMSAEPTSVANGWVDKFYFNPEDGWYYMEGTVETETAREKIKKGWKPSVAYRVTRLTDGGTLAGISFDRTLRGLQFGHLAIVPQPRYEASNFRLNAIETPENTPEPMSLITLIKKALGKSADGKPVVTEEVVKVNPLSTLSFGGNPVALGAAFESAFARKNAADAQKSKSIVLTLGTVFEHVIDGKTVRLNYADIRASERLNEYEALKKNEGESDEDFEKRKKTEKEKMEKENAMDQENLCKSEALARTHAGEHGPDAGLNVVQTATETTKAGTDAKEVSKVVLADGLGQVPGPDSVRANAADIEAGKKDMLFLTSPAARTAAGVIHPAQVEDGFAIGKRLYGSDSK